MKETLLKATDSVSLWLNFTIVLIIFVQSALLSCNLWNP